ncbi:MAG TPA: type VI secretion system tube protein Hcp, partial [Thermoanaerobaculia bacterium]|nr:type VI secretion system tube protein Hcp [Thermoanaerobaculia bacterium]
MKHLGRLFVAFSLLSIPCFAAQEATIDIKGKPLVVSSFSWGVANSCASNEMHFTVAGDGAAPLVQACRTNEVLPAVQIEYLTTRHELQGAHVSCQNNMFTIRFDRCATHARPAPIAASLLPPVARLGAASTNQLVFDSNTAQASELLGVQTIGPNTVVLKRKASPLFTKCANGSHFKEATITMRKAGGGQQEYLKVKLQDIRVSGYSRAADGTENITLNFSRSDAPLAG